MDNNPLQMLDAGYTVVTASRRLARRLQFDYAQRQMALGRTAWPTPDILPWQAWLQRCWEEHAAAHSGLLLLNPQQEQVLWQRIIEASPRSDGLLQPANTARRVSEAWGLLQQYRVAFDAGEGRLNEDTRAFHDWATTFQAACRDGNWCDSEALPGLLAEAGAWAKADSRGLVLLGFERITPRQQQLIEVLQAGGCRVVLADPEPAAAEPARRVQGCADSRAEIRAAAAWARGLLERDPDRRIGVVVPDLQARRSDIVAAFEDILTPGRLPGLDDSEPPFSLSLGRPLTDYPLIDCAFSLLALAARPLTVADWGALLRSPYLAGAGTEAVDRSRLDARLRDYGEVRPDTGTVLFVANHRLEAERRPQIFLEALAAARNEIRELPRRAPPGQWAETMTALLSRFGWPGERRLDNGEYQVYREWRRVLEQFVTLQLVDESIDCATALNRLRHIATATGFQPETAETPIEVMGFMGAADMAFDHLWIMGMEEETWPPPPRPNPFLSLDLQRRYRMPRCTAELCLEEGRQVLGRLLQSAGEVIASYPRSEGERVLRPSPLLGVPERPEAAVASAAAPDYPARILAVAELETWRDERAPALAVGSPVAGGAGLFRDQAACPFRAFARYRLRAGTLEEADIGLDARERGQLVHRLMHVLWQRLQTLERLQVLAETGELEPLLAAAVAETIETARRRHPQTWTARFTELERERLLAVARDWLEQERRRAPFRVLACELDQDIELEGVAVHTRIDRIDRLEDGAEVIIDYKTGRAGVNDWLGERPDDPQLPLYAATREGDVAAIGFALLRRGRDFGYRGLARSEGILPDTPAFTATRQARQLAGEGGVPGWEELVTGWRRTLAGLARDFREGDARVDPKTPQSCRYCEQHALCRVYEQASEDLRFGREDDDD